MKERAEVCGEQIGNDGGKLVAVDIDDQLLEMSEVIEWNEFVSVVFEAKIAKGFGARKEKEFEVLTATGSSDVKADEMEFGARTGRRSAKFAFEGFEMFDRVEQMERFNGSEADLRDSEYLELLSSGENDTEEHEVVGHLGVLF